MRGGRGLRTKAPPGLRQRAGGRAGPVRAFQMCARGCRVPWPCHWTNYYCDNNYYCYNYCYGYGYISMMMRGVTHLTDCTKSC